MSPECVCKVLAKNTPQIFLYSMLKWSHYEGEQKHTVVSVPLNANELLLEAQRVHSLCHFTSHRRTENF